MILAEPRSAVAIAFQHFADGCSGLRDHAVVTGKAGSPLDQKARSAIVMIAPREQRRARRAADRGGVEAVVTQAARGEFVECRCGHGATEGAHLSEANVVQQNDDNIWCTGGWRWNPGPVHFGLQIRLADLAAKRQFRQGELRAVTICFNVRFLGCHGVLSLSNAASQLAVWQPSCGCLVPNMRTPTLGARMCPSSFAHRSVSV